MKNLCLFLILFSTALVSGAELSPSEQSDFRIPIDGDAPIINILSPQNITYNNLTPILFNFTIIELTLDSVWYSLNDVNNITIFSSFHLNLSEGPYILKIYANDSLNRIDFEEVNFTVNNSISFCGNNLCDIQESCSSCSSDCGACAPPPSGNGGGGGGGSGSTTTIPPEQPEEPNTTSDDLSFNETPDTTKSTPEITTPPGTKINFRQFIPLTLITIIAITIIFLILNKIKSKKKTKKIWKKKKLRK